MMMMRMKGNQARMTKCQFAISSILLLSLLHEGVCQDVVIKELDVPAHVQRFTNVTLQCLYESDQVPFFIKWDHNDVQFVKYAPMGSDPLTIFDEEGPFKVIREQTTGETVVLHEVDLGASGNYTCSVQGHPPNFMEDKKTKTMTVVVVPVEQLPSIEGNTQAHYAVGDTVNLTCTSPPSIPVATLFWYINEKKAPEEYLHHYPSETTEEGLEISKLLLTFKLSHSHIDNGELNLKCDASVPPLYLKSKEHSQQGPPKNMEERNLPDEESYVRDGASGSTLVMGSVSNIFVFPVMFLLSVNFLH